MSFLYTSKLLFSFPRKCYYSKKFLLLRHLLGHCQVMAFPLCCFQIGETIPPPSLSHSMLYFMFHYSGVSQSPQSHGSGSSLVSSILMARKLVLSGLTTGRNYPVRHCCILETCHIPKPSLRGRKRPIASIV
jgi:hypothetical protein